MDIQLQQKINNIQDNHKIKRAWEVFDNAQRIYEQATEAITIKHKPRYKGSYSSSLSPKNYTVILSLPRP